MARCHCAVCKAATGILLRCSSLREVKCGNTVRLRAGGGARGDETTGGQMFQCLIPGSRSVLRLAAELA
ncbi:hypothetical protein E2C01_065612 [Portunus trituberculatus]|uniref:Uncharacterized protein n=1 Tax=Portunus trituberculatus TaxID=210409 RepID=A0A5B7HN10_PORTR|nr:hypothetical protein [Portunus trituberculatus]